MVVDDSREVAEVGGVRKFWSCADGLDLRCSRRVMRPLRFCPVLGTWISKRRSVNFP